VQADVLLIDIKDILRHKSIFTTEVYIHRLKSVRASLRVLEGKSKDDEKGELTVEPVEKLNLL